MAADKNKETAAANAAASSPQGGEASKENNMTAAANAAASKVKKPSKKAKFVVASKFRDKDNFKKIFEEGEDVSGFDADRLADLVSRGLVKEI